MSFDVTTGRETVGQPQAGSHRPVIQVACAPASPKKQRSDFAATRSLTCDQHLPTQKASVKTTKAEAKTNDCLSDCPSNPSVRLSVRLSDCPIVRLSEWIWLGLKLIWRCRLH